MISNTGRRSNQVLTSPESNIHSGGMNSSTGLSTASSETASNAVETSFSYDSNPVYTGFANDNLHNIENYFSIRQESIEPSGGASTNEHIYDSPVFEEN